MMPVSNRTNVTLTIVVRCEAQNEIFTSLFSIRLCSLKFRGRRGGDFCAGFASLGGSDAGIVTGEISRKMQKSAGLTVISFPE